MATLRSPRRGHNPDPRPPVERVLEALGDAAKPAGPKKWACRCPAHDDRRASLSVSVSSDGTAILKCHRGCGLAVILAALRLDLADLFPPASKLPAGEGGRP